MLFHFLRIKNCIFLFVFFLFLNLWLWLILKPLDIAVKNIFDLLSKLVLIVFV